MTLGQVLKSKRLELGKSIEQIATATRIHINVLKALEEDHYSELPARAFTRGFIISYCKALQINADKILRDYHDFLESKYSERPEKDHGHHGYAFEGKESEQNKRWLITIASGAAFFAILTLLFFKPQNHKHKEKHKELIAEEAEITTAMNVPITTSTIANLVDVTPAEKMTIEEKATPTPTTTPPPAATATPKQDPLNKGDDISPVDAQIKIVIIAIEDTLIHYHSDDRKPFSIMLRKDKQLVIKGTKLVRVQTNSPEHLKYKLGFKNKPISSYLELKTQRLELHSDGSETSFDAGAL